MLWQILKLLESFPFYLFLDQYHEMSGQCFHVIILEISGFTLKSQIQLEWTYPLCEKHSWPHRQCLAWPFICTNIVHWLYVSMFVSFLHYVPVYLISLLLLSGWLGIHKLSSPQNVTINSLVLGWIIWNDHTFIHRIKIKVNMWASWYTRSGMCISWSRVTALRIFKKKISRVINISFS